MYNPVRMRVVFVTLFSLALSLEACSAPPAPVDRSIPSAPLPAIASPEPTLAPANAGFLIYYLFPGKSRASYSITIHPAGQNDVSETVIGSTMQVTGSIRLRANDPAQATLDPIKVDLSQLASDDSKRDLILRDQYLETNRYPTATFIAEKIEGLPGSYKEGQVVFLKITGKLTIRDIIRTITVDAQVQRSSGKISGKANTTILMSDFGFGPIVLPDGSTLEDQVILNLEFTAMPLVE